MNNPITRSCLKTVLEKQIVLRAKRLIRARKFRCLFSVFGCFVYQFHALMYLNDAYMPPNHQCKSG
jgi:hypothetical protein